MDRSKLRRQLNKKAELESRYLQSRESVTTHEDFLVKPSSTRSGDVGFGNFTEKPPKFSISATNLKIKKAHSTTLKDFFSQQKEQLMASYKPKKRPSELPASRMNEERKGSSGYKRERVQKQSPETDEPNLMTFYQRNSSAIVRHILKMSQDNLHSIRDDEYQENNYPIQDEKEGLPALKTGSHQMMRTTSNTFLKNKPQTNPDKKNVQFTDGDSVFEKISSEKGFLLPISNGRKLDSGNSIQRQVMSQEKMNNLPSSSKSSRQTMADKMKDEIYHPRKFYFLNSIGFKNYKYPRPTEMPFEKENEKRTRMPLYLMPQSAPSREIEQICIDKFQTEVNGIQQNIQEKQSLNPSESGLVVADLEATKQNYVSEIVYIQERKVATQQKARFKSNAKYTFGDSKSKVLNSISLRSNKIEDLSDILYRTKSKVEKKIEVTQENINRIQQEHQSLLLHQQTQNSTQGYLNQSIQQIYKELVSQSDALQNSHTNYINQHLQLEGEDLNHIQSSPPQQQQKSGYIKEEADEDIMNEQTINNQQNPQNDALLQEQLIQQQELYVKQFIQNKVPLKQQQNEEENDMHVSDRANEDIEDNLQIKSLSNFKTTQPLTDLDIIQRHQHGKLIVSVFINSFPPLSLNRQPLRNRILLALGLNPDDQFGIVSKEQFETFYLTLVQKTSTPSQTADFIIKFFKLDDEDEDELPSQHHKINPKKTLQREEFQRILRLLTISIDEKAKSNERSLYDYMIENLTLTEVLRSNDPEINLEQFRSVLLDGKINPKDLIDLICNLQ